MRCEACSSACPPATRRPLAPTQPGLPADAPLNLLDVIGTGYPVRNDNTTTPAYLGSGDGTSSPETYLAVHPANALSTSPIKPGGSILIKNKQVGAKQGGIAMPAAGSCLCRYLHCSEHTRRLWRAPLFAPC